jgi:hypothetical protein
MNNWQTYIKDIGELKVKDKIVVKFQANDSIPEIKQLKSTCGCTQPKFDTKTNILSVTYTTQKFPRHIKGNTQLIKKPIHVYYKDGTYEVLYLQGTKIR